MAKKPETLYKERLIKKLTAIENSWWVKTQMLSILGIPDYLGVVNGYFVALELKASKKSPKYKLQEYVIEKIKKAGGFAEFIYPENEVLVLTNLIKHTQKTPHDKPLQ